MEFADRRLFDIEGDNLILRLPVLLMVRLLASNFDKHFDYILNKTNEHLKQSMNPDNFGGIIENLFVLAFCHGNVNVTFKLTEFFKNVNIKE